MSASIDEQLNNNQQQQVQPAYIIANTTTPGINNVNETTALCDIKIVCSSRKKRSKRYIYLTFVESCELSSSDEQPCIELLDKTCPSTILLNDCISFEYFDTVKNDFDSFTYIYFENYTVSIWFPDEFMPKKSSIMKYLDSIYKKKTEKSAEMKKHSSLQELPISSVLEQILHTFDVKLIPHGTIIDRDHALIGHVRLYFTTTDLYIAAIDCKQADLRTTIAHQCPPKDKPILCIPYFTIKNYGNRSTIFLIELGKSNYGNDEIHMKCISSSLASTIHLLVSPVIEERPLILSSAFQNQLLTNKRIEKSKNIHPPIQLNHDAASQSVVTDRSLPHLKRSSIECLSDNSSQRNETKSRSVFGWVRKLIKNKTRLRHSLTFDTDQSHLNQPSSQLSSSINKFFELHIEEKPTSVVENLNSIPKSQIISSIPTVVHDKNHQNSLILPLSKETSTIGTYIDMGPAVQKTDQHQKEENHEEKIIKELASTGDIGVNTIISLPPHIRSAILVGNSVHLITEERCVYPIGQRSFTSPASVMQPFKAQLKGQPNTDETNMVSCTTNNSSSIHQPTSTSNSQQSLLLSYGIVTLNKSPLTNDQTDRTSSPLSDGSNIDRRLNSDLSLMSTFHQRHASNTYSYDKILSSSSSSQIFRTLSLSTNNIGDNTSGQICTSNGNIILIDENLNDQTISYLLGSPPLPFIDDKIQTNLSSVSSINLTGSMSRSHLLTNINEEKVPSYDSYAFVEPLNLNNTPLPNVRRILAKPTIISEQSINYVDVILPASLPPQPPSSSSVGYDDDEQYDSNTSDQNNDQCNNLMEGRMERSSTVIYTDIDFQQTERRDRIAQLAAICESSDKTPPFVL